MAATPDGGGTTVSCMLALGSCLNTYLKTYLIILIPSATITLKWQLNSFRRVMLYGATWRLSNATVPFPLRRLLAVRPLSGRRYFG